MMNSYSDLYLQEVEKKIVDEKLNKIKDQLKEEHQNDKHTFITITSYSLLISGMNDLITEKAIDMVIMGTKGATGAKEIFNGTNTMHAIKNIQSPILIVPADFEYEQLKEILFPTNFDVIKTNKYLPLIKGICNEYSSKLHILTISDEAILEETQKENKIFLNDYFKDNAHSLYVSKGQSVINGIEVFEVKHKVNLLVMFYNKHSLIENLLFKPTINEIVYHTHVPFLVLPSNY